jgi:UDP:flavonoid glycosyltransferase YjiC (YdhE family)
MRFLFSTTRGTGHVEPLLPYARALLARGHEVIVAAPEEVGVPLRKAGIAHAPFGHPGDEALSPIWAMFATATEAESIAIAAREIFAGLNARAALPKLRETMRSFRPELVVRDSVEFASLIAADEAGVPHARIAVHSVSFEDTLPDLIAAPLAAQRAELGLTPDHGASLAMEPVFTAFPESLEEPPPVGVRNPAPIRARMPDELPDVPHDPWTPNADARPLVYITFGTLVGSNPRGRVLYKVALDAVAELPVRALLTTGRGFDRAALGAVPSNVQVEEFIPQREVFAHARAVVCHGGSGTVRGALAAGLPMVVIPVGADQPYNAQRVAAVGAGIALPKPDVAAVRAAIERVLADAELRAGASKMAADIAALPALDHAVDALIALAKAR